MDQNNTDVHPKQGAEQGLHIKSVTSYLPDFNDM